VQVEDKIGSLKQLFFWSRVREVLKSIFDFLLSLVVGLVGIVTFVACFIIIFRHGVGLAEISFLELGLFIWLFFCFYSAISLAKEQERSVILTLWRLFVITGWLMVWSCLAYAAWFKWGAASGYKVTFFASNLFEVSVLLVVGIGSWLGSLPKVELDEDKQNETNDTGDLV